MFSEPKTGGKMSILTLDIEANILANELCRSGFYEFSSVLAVANKLAQIHVLYNQYMVTTIEPFEFVSRVFVVS